MSKQSSWMRIAGALAAAALSTMAASAQNYTLATITSDGSVAAPNTDANLVNPWGLGRGTGGPWWVSDNGTGKSTLYNGAGTSQGLVVTIPSGSGSGTGTPTGTIFNGSTDFALTPGNPAVFVFATEDGTISGWSPNVNENAAVIMVNNANAVYKGLTAAWSNGAQYLYVTNFRSGQLEVYDTNFKLVSMPMGAFEALGARRRGLVPFNVQNIGGTLFVAYAKQDAQKHDNVNGPGLGLVAAFTPQGQLRREFDWGSGLNAPWGLAEAPSDFGSFSHDVLVGQFGSGNILAFNTETGRLDGMLADPNNAPIAIDGLWGISFGSSSTNNGNFNTLYFAAGPNGEANGVMGTLTPVSTELTQGNDL